MRSAYRTGRLGEWVTKREMFAKWEFKATHLLCCSDCESMTVKDLLELAPPTPVDALLNVRLNYTETEGSLGLRTEISKLYTTVKPDHILVHVGAEEAIFGFSRAVLQPGDHIIVLWPCYQSLHECAASRGCYVTPWKLQENEDGRWSLDFEFLENALQDDTRAIVVNTPHNPTGFCIDAPSMHRLVAICRAHNLILFCDEVYRGLERAPLDVPPAACDLYEKAVSLGVMSKAFGLAGLRIGWIATQSSSIRTAMAQYKDYLTICPPAPSVYLAELALQKKAALLDRERTLIARNLPLIIDFFARHKDVFAFEPPLAGCIAYPRLRGTRSSLAFCTQLVESTGVLLLPSSFYEPEDDRHFRIGFGREGLPAALAALEAFLKQTDRL